MNKLPKLPSKQMPSPIKPEKNIKKDKKTVIDAAASEASQKNTKAFKKKNVQALSTPNIPRFHFYFNNKKFF